MKEETKLENLVSPSAVNSQIVGPIEFKDPEIVSEKSMEIKQSDNNRKLSPKNVADVK